MRAQAQAKMVKKIAMARQRSEEKRNADVINNSYHTLCLSRATA